MTKREEHQPRLTILGPGHRTTYHEGFRGKAFLGSALGMGRFRGVVEFFVVAMAAANDVVTLLGRQCGETVEVVLPLLDRGEAGAGVGQRGLHGGIVVGFSVPSS